MSATIRSVFIHPYIVVFCCLGENLITQMDNYFNFLAGSAKNRKGLWTSPYLDAFGLGLMVTHAIPCISSVDGTYVQQCELTTQRHEKITDLCTK